MAKPRIECIRVGGLEAFAEREARSAPAGSVPPISRCRARAWAANPHATAEDVALIVARLEDGRCAGYVGLLPGRVCVRRRLEPVSWLSTLYVPEALRGYAIGGLLMMRAISLGRTLAAMDSSAEAERTYRAVGFAPPIEIEYLVLDLHRRHNWIGAPLRAVRRLSQRLGGGRGPAWLDRAIALCGRVTARPVLTALDRLARRRIGRWLARSCDGAPPGLEAAISGTKFVRDRELLEWMLRHPWVTTDRGAERPDYFFDDYRREHFHRCYDLIEERGGASAGWMVLWLDTRAGQRRLHVLDHSHVGPAGADAMLAAVLRKAACLGVDGLLLPASSAAGLARLGAAGRLFEARRRRAYIRPAANSTLRGALSELELQYADGDTGFA